MPDRWLLSTLGDKFRRLILLTIALVCVVCASEGQGQDRGDLEAQGRCLDSLVNWPAVTAMLTAGSVVSLDQVYGDLWEHSVATDVTYAVRRYELRPDNGSMTVVLAVAPQNRVDTWLLDRLLYSAGAHVPEGSLRESLAHVPADYYEALGEVVAKKGVGYAEFLRLGGIVEGDFGELFASRAVQLWRANRPAFTKALAGLDEFSRRNACNMFRVEAEPWTKDKGIQRLCPARPSTGGD